MTRELIDMIDELIDTLWAAHDCLDTDDAREVVRAMIDKASTLSNSAERAEWWRQLDGVRP